MNSAWDSEVTSDTAGNDCLYRCLAEIQGTKLVGYSLDHVRDDTVRFSGASIVGGNTITEDF